jgi:hypothetical protein
VIVIFAMEADEDDSHFEVSLMTPIMITIATKVISVSIVVTSNVSENSYYNLPAKTVGRCTYIRLATETGSTMCRGYTR